MTRRNDENFSSPLNFFLLFFTRVLLQEICDFTNKYAWTHILEYPTYANKNGAWTATNIDEILQLIGLIMYMGATKFHSISEFWSTMCLYSPKKVIQNIMSRNRFQALMAFLHVVDQDKESPTDKLSKVRRLLRHMKTSCRTVYKPFEHVSVDERMVRSKHRSGMKQYIRNKPVKWGFKIWVIADASNGYTYDFDVYSGKSEVASARGQGYDVVTRLTRSLAHQGYFVFFDNFFSSPRLVKDLWEKGFRACGTITENRRGFPAIFKKKLKVPNQKKAYDKQKRLIAPKRKAWGQTAERGQVRWVREDNLLFLQWKDKKVVTMISSAHAGGKSVPTLRSIKVDDKWQSIELQKPLVIDSYNKFMSGVDRSDQLIGKYNVLMRCVKWWKVLFFHCIDIAVVNSYILFQLWRQQHPERCELKRNKNYSQINFREELTLQLLSLPVPFADTPVPGATAAVRKPRMEVRAAAIAAAVPIISSPAKFIHLPEVIDKQKNCTLCYSTTKVEKKTYIKCRDCEKTHLCLTKERNCFVDWHSPKFLEIRTKRNRKK